MVTRIEITKNQTQIFCPKCHKVFMAEIRVVQDPDHPGLQTLGLFGFCPHCDEKADIRKIDDVMRACVPNASLVALPSGSLPAGILQ